MHFNLKKKIQLHFILMILLACHVWCRGYRLAVICGCGNGCGVGGSDYGGGVNVRYGNWGCWGNNGRRDGNIDCCGCGCDVGGNGSSGVKW